MITFTKPQALKRPLFMVLSLLTALSIEIANVQAQTTATTFPSEAHTLSPQALQERLAGKRFTSSYANGMKVTMNYGVDQSVQLDLSSGLSARGTWRVDGSQLCFQFQTVPSGCSEVRATASHIYQRRYTSPEVIALQTLPTTDAPPLAANTSASQLVVHVASAQTIPPVRDPSEVRFWNYFDRESRKHSAIQWSLEPKEFGFFTTPENQLLVPDGFKPDAGGWPAVVVTPTCGGTKASTRERIKEFLGAGYAVLTVESYKPRNTPSCRPGVVNPPTVFTDTLDALAALHTVAWINKNRIFQVGYSMGGFTAAWVASASNVGQTHGAQRFIASVGHYGSCAYQHNATALKLPFLRRDSDRPLLMLMAENDLETPAAWCFPLLEEMKAAGQNVSGHIYPSMTHAWDQPESNGYSFTNGWGKQVVYRYDRATTQDATRRTLEFLEQFK